MFRKRAGVTNDSTLRCLGGTVMLSYGEEVNAGGTKISHGFDHFVFGFSDTHHNTGFGEHIGIFLFNTLEDGGDFDRIPNEDRELLVYEATYGFNVVCQYVWIGFYNMV